MTKIMFWGQWHNHLKPFSIYQHKIMLLKSVVVKEKKQKTTLI